MASDIVAQNIRDSDFLRQSDAIVAMMAGMSQTITASGAKKKIANGPCANENPIIWGPRSRLSTVSSQTILHASKPVITMKGAPSNNNAG